MFYSIIDSLLTSRKTCMLLVRSFYDNFVRPSVVRTGALCQNG